MQKISEFTAYIKGRTYVSIGRGMDNTIRLDNRSVSKEHAVIYYRDERWHVSDNNSTNGTFVDGNPVKDYPLTEGEEIVLASYRLKWFRDRIVIYGAENTVYVQEAGEEIEENAEKPLAGAYPLMNRSPRLRTACPEGTIEIEAAPSIGSKPEMDWVAVLLPIGATLIMSLVMTVATAGVGMLFSLPMTLVGVFMSVRNYKKQNKRYASLEQNREQKYKAYLEEKEALLKQTADRQRAAVADLNRSPQECVKMVERMDSDLWGRTWQDDDFLALRMGVGEERLCVEINVPKVGLSLEEDAYARMPQRLAEKYQVVKGVPRLCNLYANTSLGVAGDRESVVSAVRSLVIQAVTYHSYNELKLVVVYSSKEKEQWEWMRWLPHVFSESRDIRYMLTDSGKNEEILKRLESELKERVSAAGQYDSERPLPHYLFILASGNVLPHAFFSKYVLIKQGMDIGVSFIQLETQVSGLTANIHQVLTVKGVSGEFYYKNNAGNRAIVKLDSITLKEAEDMARKLAPVRLPLVCDTSRMPSYISFLEGFGVRKVDELEIGEYWSNASTQDSMAVPIGIRANGQRFYFDIHPKAHGPHGLVGGMTGSGKTEMIQTWILSMALQYSPQDVAFVLIDFKGTGLLEPFAGKLPHVASTLSNLDRNISKNLIALRSELTRRQKLFSDAGVTKISEYHKLLQVGRVTEPLPYLFVVIDEYKEFKKQFPDFTAEIDSLFATGRSLGVLIVVMAQNPDGAISADTESNVHFRWCLKVANAAASKSVLGGHPDAAYINTPGRGYVRVGEDETFELVQSFFSGAPYEPEKAGQDKRVAEVYPMGINGIREVPLKGKAKGSKKAEKQIDVVVRHIREYAKRNNIPKARSIWSGNLEKIQYLPDVLERVTVMQQGELMPAVGILDDPALQEQRPLQIPMSRDGHVLLYGASGSGKSIWLQTLIVSLCTQYSPEEVNIYAVDFDKWTLGLFKDYPQVGGIAYSNDTTGIEKTIQLISDILEERKRLFGQVGAGTLKGYCHITKTQLPSVILMLDKYDLVNDLCPKLGEFLYYVAQQGKPYGVYLVMTVNDKNAVSYKFKTHIKTTYVLQMNDSQEYKEILGYREGLVPERCEGRGLCKEGQRALEFQTALPTDDLDELERMDHILEIGKKLCDYYGSKRAGQLPIMPEIVEYTAYEDAMVLGMEMNRVTPVGINWDKWHYLLISGMRKSGKTTLLRMLAQQALDGGGQAVIYGNAKEYEDCTGAQILGSIEEADAYVQNLEKELVNRDELRKAGTESFLPIFIFIDGYGKFFRECEQSTWQRIRALQQLGEGLGIYLTISDDSEVLEKCSNDVVVTLAAGNHVVISGGSVIQHMELYVSMDVEEKKKAMKMYEAYYMRDGQVEHVKIMNARENV